MFYPLPVIEASKKEKKELKSCCCCRQKTWKKKSQIHKKWNIMMNKKNINCAWRDTLYLLHSWSFWFEDSIIIHATKCFWSHETSRDLSKTVVRHFFKTVDLSALLNTDAYKKCNVCFWKIIMLLFCQLKYCRGIIKLYHDMWKNLKYVFFSIRDILGQEI